jgi:hypothetical protein
VIVIYYIQYATLILDDGLRVSDFIPFAKYLDITLTTAHYRVGHGASKALHRCLLSANLLSTLSHPALMTNPGEFTHLNA